MATIFGAIDLERPVFQADYETVFESTAPNRFWRVTRRPWTGDSFHGSTH